MLKVMGGKYRSRMLLSPGEETIPTKGRVKEAIFSALHEEMEGASILDLFAGSGALGIEALSRGASFSVFVDESDTAIKVIEGNLKALKENNAEVHKGDSLEFLENCQRKFDIIFLDPPYLRDDLYGKSIEMIISRDLLNPEGILMIEYEGEKQFALDEFSSSKEYHYGRTRVVIARK